MSRTRIVVHLAAATLLLVVAAAGLHGHDGDNGTPCRLCLSTSGPGIEESGTIFAAPVVDETTIAPETRSGLPIAPGTEPISRRGPPASL